MILRNKWLWKWCKVPTCLWS